MSWEILQPFHGASTNIPIERLLTLGFPESQLEMSKLIELEDELIRYALEALSLQKKSSIYSDKLEKALQSLVSIFVGQASVANFKDRLAALVRVTRPQDSTLLIEIVAKWKAYENAIASAEKVFASELVQKRRLLYEFMTDEAFLLALFELNPSLIVFFDSKREDDLGKRNKQARRFETTLVSYISRIAAKSAFCGLGSPSLRVKLGNSEKAATSSEKSISPLMSVSRHEAFFSIRCAHILCEKILESEDILERLPLACHPLLIFEKTRLRAPAYLSDHFFLPHRSFAEIDKTLLSYFKSLESSACLIDMVTAVGEEYRPVIRELLKANFLVHQLGIPPGVSHPLEYIYTKLEQLFHKNTSKSYEYWKEIITTFISLKSGYAVFSIADKSKILEQASKLFQDVTGASPETGKGDYYADKYIFYTDSIRAPETFDLPISAVETLQEDFTFALELCSIDWWYKSMHHLLAAEKFNKKIVSAETEGEVKELLGEWFRTNILARNKAVPSSRMKEILNHIDRLRDLRDKIWKGIDLNEREVVIRKDDPNVIAFREYFRKSVNRLKYPTYVGGPIIQIERDARGPGIIKSVVLESLRFGSAMNLTHLAYFALDRETQLKTFAPIFQMLYRKPEKKLINASAPFRQVSKTFVAIAPGSDFEVGAPTFKDEDARINARALLENKNKMFLGIPGSCILDMKFFLSDKTKKTAPRITFGKAILQRAQWHIHTEEYSRLIDQSKEMSSFQLFLTMSRLRKTLGLPRFVFAAPSESGKNIMIDFENLFLMEAFMTMMRTNKYIRISEMIPAPDHFPIKENSNSFTAALMPFIYYKYDS